MIEILELVLRKKIGLKIYFANVITQAYFFDLRFVPQFVFNVKSN
jgi:hypothetical protein